MTESLLQWYFDVHDAGDRDDHRQSVGTRHRDVARAHVDAAHDDTAHDDTAHDDTADAADRALALRIRSGDAEAFDALTRLHLTSLVRFAVSIVRSRDVAEDLVQDVLARLWMQRTKMPAIGSVRAVLFTAVRHHALNRLKHERVVHRTMATLERDAVATRTEDAHAAVGIPEALIHDEPVERILARIHAAIANLPERQRSAVTLRYSQGLRVAEIGTIMGVSTKAAEQLLVRALRTLRTAIEAGAA